jgi:hypothetical protein
MNLHSGTGTNRASGSGGNNNNNNNNNLPNPPIHPTLADVLAQQTQVLGQLVNHIGNMGNAAIKLLGKSLKLTSLGNSSAPTHPSSMAPRILLMRIFGLMQLRKNLVSFNMSNMRRFYLPLTNFMTPPRLGDGIWGFHGPKNTVSRGRSFGQHFAPSTSPRALWTSRKWSF